MHSSNHIWPQNQSNWMFYPSYSLKIEHFNQNSGACAGWLCVISAVKSQGRSERGRITGRADRDIKTSEKTHASCLVHTHQFSTLLGIQNGSHHEHEHPTSQFYTHWQQLKINIIAENLLDNRPALTSKDVSQIKQYTHTAKNGIPWNLNPLPQSQGN